MASTTKLQLVITARNEASKTLTGLNKQLSKFANNTELQNKIIKRGLFAISAGFTAITAGAIIFGKKSLNAYIIQENAMARLKSGLKNVKGMTDDNAESLSKYAAELQKTTTFGDETTISSMAMLSTFQLNENQIKELTPRIQDMTASLEKSTGQQQDMEQIAISVGKAMTLGVGSLSRYGVVISDNAKKEFRNADAMGKVRILTEELDKNYKGIAEGSANTFGGKIKQINNIFGDFKEEIGEGIAEGLDPLISRFKKIAESEKTQNMIKDLKDMVKRFTEEGVKKAVEAIETWIEDMGGREGLEQKAKDLWIVLKNDVIPTVKEFTATLKDNIEVIAAIIGWILKVKDKYDELKGMIDQTTDKLGAFKRVFKAIKYIYNPFINPIRFIADFIKKLKFLKDNSEELTKGVKAAFDGIGDSIADAFKGVGSRIAGYLKPAASFINKMIAGYNDLPGTKNIREIRWRQYGGSVKQGEVGMVGEHGPEMFIPSQSGNIRNANQMQGTTINLSINNPVIREENDIVKLANQIQAVFRKQDQINQLGI